MPYTGSKARIAAEVWAHVGARCRVVVDPFMGGGSLLLSRPREQILPGYIEVVGDLDHFVINFWRALRGHPDALADHVDYPVSEDDLTARHWWLMEHGRQRLSQIAWEHDPYACDIEIAAWWCWGISAWIGGGWCADTPKWRRRPKVTLNGVNRRVELAPWFGELATRLRHVQMWHRDWRECLVDSLLNDRNGGDACVLLDPPYNWKHRHQRPNSPLYAVDTNPAAEVLQWCRDNDHRSKLKIVAFGLEGDGTETLEQRGWTKLNWSARGMSNQGHDTPNKQRRHMEIVMFSPTCRA